jgi:hypothetical protein
MLGFPTISHYEYGRGNERLFIVPQTRVKFTSKHTKTVLLPPIKGCFKLIKIYMHLAEIYFGSHVYMLPLLKKTHLQMLK